MVELVAFVLLVMFYFLNLQLKTNEGRKTINRRVNIAIAEGRALPNDVCRYSGVRVSTQALYEYFCKFDDFLYIMRVADGVHVIIDFDKLERVRRVIELNTPVAS